MDRPDEAPQPEIPPRPAWWPMVLLWLYVLTLAVGAAGELFDIPTVKNLWLFR